MRVLQRVGKTGTMFGLVALASVWMSHPAFATWPRERVVVASPTAYVVASPTVAAVPVPMATTTTVYTSPTVALAPSSVVVADPVVAVPGVPLTTTTTVIRTGYTVAPAVVASPTVVASPVVVERGRPARLVVPRRVYRFAY